MVRIRAALTSLIRHSGIESPASTFMTRSVGCSAR
jgi:hypothetical protein